MQVSALFARFGEPTELFHTGVGIVLLQEPLHVNFCAFCAFKRTTNFYLQIPYTKIPVIITTTF